MAEVIDLVPKGAIERLSRKKKAGSFRLVALARTQRSAVVEEAVETALNETEESTAAETELTQSTKTASTQTVETAEPAQPQDHAVDLAGAATPTRASAPVGHVAEEGGGLYRSVRDPGGMPGGGMEAE